MSFSVLSAAASKLFLLSPHCRLQGLCLLKGYHIDIHEFTYLSTEFIYYLVIGMVKIFVQYKNDCGLNFT